MQADPSTSHEPFVRLPAHRLYPRGYLRRRRKGRSALDMCNVDSKEGYVDISRMDCDNRRLMGCVYSASIAVGGASCIGSTPRHPNVGVIKRTKNILRRSSGLRCHPHLSGYLRKYHDCGGMKEEKSGHRRA